MWKALFRMAAPESNINISVTLKIIFEIQTTDITTTYNRKLGAYPPFVAELCFRISILI